jgi:hypothetical protein
MTLYRHLRDAEAEGRALAHQSDRNTRLFAAPQSYWRVVHDWAFDDEWQKMKAEHARLHAADES